MKSLQNKLYEGFYKNAGGVPQPRNKAELQKEIMTRLDRGIFDLNGIDISKITDMSFLFQPLRTYDLSKIDISEWDTSNVKDMDSMFYLTNFNQDISNWDTSNVTNMDSMFYCCKSFNSDISKWDVSKVTNMDSMFYACDNFNSDLSKWNTGRVKVMRYMFYECIKFNSDLSKWDVSKVTNMNSMFEGCSKFNCDLSKWDVRNVRDMKYLFQGCSNFSADLSNWKVNGQVELFNTFNRSSAEEPRWYQKISRNREREAFKSIISGRIHF